MRSSFKRFSIVLSVAALMLAAGSAGADDPRAAPPGGITSADKLFLDNAAYAGMTEIKAGQMAQKKGTTDAIKDYGKKLVDDHARINDQLKALAASKSVTLPTKPDAEHQTMIETLEKSSGSAFDSAFVTAMKHGHDNTIAQFDRAKASKDSDIVTFASKTVVILREHVETIPNATPTKP